MKPLEAVGFIFLKNRKVLLEKRWEHEDNYAGIWAVPGGHVEKKRVIGENSFERSKRRAWNNGNRA